MAVRTRAAVGHAVGVRVQVADPSRPTTGKERRHAMLNRIVKPWIPWAAVPLRILVGLAFIGHGWPKLMNLGAITQTFGQMGIPAPGLFAPLVMILEVFGGAALALGLLTRWVALGYVFEMLVTTSYVQIPGGSKFIGGYELDLLFLATGLFFLLAGPGPLSLDRQFGLES